MTAEVRALRRRQHFGVLLKLSPQAILILDLDGCVREWNPAAVDLLGWTREELLGQPFETVLGTQDRAAFLQLWSDLRADRAAGPLLSDRLHHDGTRAPVEVLMASIQDVDGSFAGVVATLSSADPGGQRIAAQVAAGGAAVTRDWAVSVWERDEPTGLPGRRWLQRRLLASVPDGLERAVAVLDIDAFALVNQDYGAETGDLVLAELATRLAAHCAPAALGRWQADEFLLVLDGASAEADLRRLVETAAQEVRRPLDLGDDTIRLTFSGGTAATPTVPASSLFKSATAAMTTAKRQGRDRTLAFDPRTMAAQGLGLRLANDLDRGIEQGEMRLHFQPIVELSTNDVMGVEALVRWERPGVGLLAPAAFIEVAERTGQIVALGEWVAHSACRAAVAFASEHLSPLRVSINVSARQFNDRGLLDMLRRALDAAHCDPTSIVIEVTETALVQDLASVAAVLEEIRDLGMEVDLDDFGTGYSSLMYLKHLPVNRLKIDQEFVSGLGTDVADTAIVASTIALAHSMGISAVAEGVETPGQLALLRQLGCDYAQGYLLSRPLPQDKLLIWIEGQLSSRLVLREQGSGHPRRAHGGSEERQELRDHIADGRDILSDRRDSAGDARDEKADNRDSESDQRDRERDRRDALADEREEMADERDALAGASSTAASVAARADATGDRVQASGDRQLAAVEREEARVARALAGSNRKLQVTQRSQERAHPGLEVRPPGEEGEGAATRFDALTGAYLWDAGRSALASEMDVARKQGESLTVVQVTVDDGDTGDRAGGQLAGDAALVMVANILGSALRPPDLLIRRTATELLCVLRALPAIELDPWLAGVALALTDVPQLSGAIRVEAADLQDDDSVEVLVARCEAARRAT